VTTANYIYGETGYRVWGTNGLDLASGLNVSLAGDGPIDPWVREVSINHNEITLSEILEDDSMIKYNLLANNVMREKGITLETIFDLYACGAVKEMRVVGKGGDAYRCIGSKYLGKRK